MKNLPKLKDAPEQLKNLSIAYDMTIEERNTLREQVKVAREKTQKSTNWVFKIRGPPWNMREVRIKKVGAH